MDVSGQSTTFLPSPTGTRALERRLTDRVLRSLNVGQRLIASRLPTLAAALDDMSHECEAAVLTHPELIHWQTRFNQVLREGFPPGQLETAAVSLDAALHIAKQSVRRTNRIDTQLDSPAARHLLAQAVRRILFRHTGAAPAFGQVDAAPVRPDSETRRLLNEALAQIAQTWPDMHDELSTLVRAVVLFDEGSAPAGRVTMLTDSHYHGAFFLSTSYLKRRAEAGLLAYDLIHEATHTYLNALLLSGVKLFRHSTGRLYATALRPDPRPLSGVFHQLLVLARAVEFSARTNRPEFAAASRPGPFSPGGTDLSVDDVIASYLRLLRDEAPLTEFGVMLLDSVAERVARPGPTRSVAPRTARQGAP
ncbi:aKG-HExxH-type peptide beta-hydroxylase [Streptomyces sp. NPDC058955]|uniref:aKG-HExxH-type peptide beta-hydroxylase n=1 Tax=unclassified Streptomyces TaxID=2593676 RepID=UPI00365A8FBF